MDECVINTGVLVIFNKMAYFIATLPPTPPLAIQINVTISDTVGFRIRIALFRSILNNAARGVSCRIHTCAHAATTIDVNKISPQRQSLVVMLPPDPQLLAALFSAASRFPFHHYKIHMDVPLARPPAATFFLMRFYDYGRCLRTQLPASAWHLHVSLHLQTANSSGTPPCLTLPVITPSERLEPAADNGVTLFIANSTGYHQPGVAYRQQTHTHIRVESLANDLLVSVRHDHNYYKQWKKNMLYWFKSFQK